MISAVVDDLDPQSLVLGIKEIAWAERDGAAHTCSSFRRYAAGETPTVRLNARVKCAGSL